MRNQANIEDNLDALVESYINEHGVEPSSQTMKALGSKAMAMAMQAAPVVDDDVKVQNYALRKTKPLIKLPAR